MFQVIKTKVHKVILIFKKELWNSQLMVNIACLAFLRKKNQNNWK